MTELNDKTPTGAASVLNDGLDADVMTYIAVRKSWRQLRDMDLPIPDAHKIFIINAAIEIAERDLLPAPNTAHERREPLSTDAACALLKDALGIDPMLDGNMLKMLRAVELAHGIGPNARLTAPDTAHRSNDE